MPVFSCFNKPSPRPCGLKEWLILLVTFPGLISSFKEIKTEGFLEANLRLFVY